MESKVVLSISFVAAGVELLSEPEQAQVFGKILGADEITVTTEVTLPSTTGVSRKFEVGQSQTEVLAEGMKATVIKKYPNSKSDVKTLVGTTRAAIDASKADESSLLAIGYNIEATYEPHTTESAANYIGERMLPKHTRYLITKGNYDPVCKSVSMAFMGNGGEVYNIRVEPRHREVDAERVFLSINHHVPSGTLPTTEEIQTSLETIWDTVDEFIDNFDRMNK